MLVRSLDDYGGPIANYGAVVDPTTDEDCKFRNRYVTDTASMTHTRPVAIRSFIGVDGADPTDPTDFVHDALWGSGNTVKPTVVRFGEGVWDLTWPSTTSDDLTLEDAALGGGVSISVNFRRAYAQAVPLAGVLKHATADVTGPNTIRVYGYLANGTADDLAGVEITVFAY